jgi:hypothetical protein
MLLLYTTSIRKYITTYLRKRTTHVHVCVPALVLVKHKNYGIFTTFMKNYCYILNPVGSRRESVINHDLGPYIHVQMTCNIDCWI